MTLDSFSNVSDHLVRNLMQVSSTVARRYHDAKLDGEPDIRTSSPISIVAWQPQKQSKLVKPSMLFNLLSKMALDNSRLVGYSS